MKWSRYDCQNYIWLIVFFFLQIYDRPEEGVVNSQTFIAHAQVNVIDPNAQTEAPAEEEDEDQGLLLISSLHGPPFAGEPRTDSWIN